MDLNYFDIQGAQQEKGFLAFALEMLPANTFLFTDSVRNLDYKVENSILSTGHLVIITPKRTGLTDCISVPEGAANPRVFIRDDSDTKRTSFTYNRIEYLIFHTPQPQ